MAGWKNKMMDWRTRWLTGEQDDGLENKMAEGKIYGGLENKMVDWRTR
jgi:hypothetical protein